MKKYISILLTIAIVFNISITGFALVGFTDETGFTTDGNGTITGYGGAIPPAGYAYATIHIPDEIGAETITAIGAGFLQNNTNVSHVIIPAGVTSIGENAFSGCSNLSEVLFLSKNGDTLNIGEGAFTGVSGSFRMRGYPNSPASTFASDNVITYSDFEDDFIFNQDTQTITGFSGSNDVTVIPNEIGGIAVTAIGDNAFSGLNVTLGWHVIISEGISSIGNDAFKQNSLRTVYLPDTLTSIGANAFQYSGLREVTIPDSVTSVGIFAFAHCCYLTEVTLTDGLSTLGSGNTFYGCTSLENISIPEGITTIPGEAFKYCLKLSGVNFPSTLTTIGEGAFYNCEDLATLALPDSLTAIGDSAFRGCNALSGTTVTIPQNVTSIGVGAFNTGASDSDKASFTTIQSDLSVTNLTLKILNGYKTGDPGALTLGNDIMSTNGSHHNSIEAYPMSSAFTYGKSLWDFTPIYTNEGYFTFESGAITAYNGTDAFVNIPDEIGSQPVTAIAGSAFANNTTIGAVIIPETVTQIGDNAFAGCTSLIRATFFGGNEVTFGTTPFDSVNASFNINALDGSYAYYYAFNNSIAYEELREFLLSGAELNDIYFDGTGIRPPNGVLTVPATLKGTAINKVISCESNNTSITGLVISEGITTLGTQAYPLPKYITGIALPGSLTNIYEYAFNNTTSLETITLSEPNNNYTVDASVLFNDDKTTLIKYPANKSGTTYEVGSGVTAITDSAFQSSQNLNSVTIKNPDCTFSGDYVFYDMPGGFTLYGYAGSTAETYAANKGITFSPLAVTATAVAVKTAPVKTSYNKGESLDLSGMVVTLTQEADPTSIDVQFANFNDYGITSSPVHGDILNDTTVTSVTITCNGQTDTFNIVVSEAPNNAPTVANAIPNQTGTVGEAFSFTFAEDTFNDADGDILTYTAASLPAGISFDTGTRKFSGTPTEAGTTSVTVTADDSNGGTVTDTFDIVVSEAPNNAPVAVDDTQTVDEDGTVLVSVLSNDTEADNDTLSIDSFTQGSNGTVAQEGNDLRYSPDEDFNGTDSFTYVVSDGNGGTDTGTVTITVNAINDAPTVANAIPNQTGTVGEAFSFTFAEDTFNDADGDILTYTAASLPAGISFDTGTRKFSGTPTEAGTTSVTVTADDSNGGTVTDTFDIVVSEANNSGGGTVTPAPQPQPEPELEPEPETELEKNEDGSVTIVVPEPEVDEETNETTVQLSLEDVEKAFEQVETNEDGKRKIELEIPKTEETKGYQVELPKTALESDHEKEIEINTDMGLVTLPGNMLGDEKSEESGNISLGFKKAEKEELDDEIKNKIGDRPVIEINLNKDGKSVEWSNEKAPVKISLPYELKEGENPEKIVVWYIDGEGKAIEVTNGRYDSKTGKVVFQVTHFSTYAVAYVEKTFDDLNDYPWGKFQVEVLAGKGIINGTGNDCFSPSANITRADFLKLLVKTLELNAAVDSNFDDVMETDYYYNELGIAKALGIANGAGGNKFIPKSHIDRQDMMVLVCRALKVKGLLEDQEDLSVLDNYSDKSEIAGYAINSVNQLVNLELILGSNNRINPKGKTTRIEAAVLLYRLYNQFD